MNTTPWLHACKHTCARMLCFLVPNELNETGMTSGPNELKAIG
jgi:uncharacterized Zn finger protein